MDLANGKLRTFYQYQIAKIAKLAREEAHPASRKRLNFMLNCYIDMWLAMPIPSERMEGVETKVLFPVYPATSVAKSWRPRRSPVNRSGPQPAVHL